MKRLIAQNVYLDENRKNCSSNELVIGSSGAGKTGGFLVPYLLETDESFVVADTKMNLYRNYKDDLERRGYKVFNLNLVEPDKGCGYDPLDYVRYETRKGKRIYNQKDIITLSQIICPLQPTEREPFWVQQSQMVISILIAYVLDEIDGADKNLSSIVDVFRCMCTSYDNTKNGVPFMNDYCIKHPDSFGAKRYQMISTCFTADKTWSSIKFIVANALQMFEFDAARKMLSRKDRFNLGELGRTKTALFLNISDTDRSLDALASIFYTQALNVLCTQADRSRNSKLTVPCRLMLDDFASNAYISDFDKMISVVRSRDISISTICQSLSQLYAYYGAARASTIIDNSDLLYYMGGQDLETANFISQRANIPLENVLALDCDKGILFRRGEKPLKVTKIVPYSMKPAFEDEQADFAAEPQQVQHSA